MRTTITIEDHLFKEAKRCAAGTGRSLRSFVEDALREVLMRRQKSRSRKLVKLPVSKGARLLPGVDLDSTAALLDLMDDYHDPHRR